MCYCRRVLCVVAVVICVSSFGRAQLHRVKPSPSGKRPEVSTHTYHTAKCSTQMFLLIASFIYYYYCEFLLRLTLLFASNESIQSPSFRFLSSVPCRISSFRCRCHIFDCIFDYDILRYGVGEGVLHSRICWGQRCILRMWPYHFNLLHPMVSIMSMSIPIFACILHFWLYPFWLIGNICATSSLSHAYIWCILFVYNSQLGAIHKYAFNNRLIYSDVSFFVTLATREYLSCLAL